MELELKIKQHIHSAICSEMYLLCEYFNTAGGFNPRSPCHPADRKSGLRPARGVPTHGTSAGDVTINLAPSSADPATHKNNDHR
ncbi:unnamed protein product, partial [Iphiclides podalirius]